MAFCPNCGWQVTDAMRFCPSCGAQLTAATAVQPVVQQTVRPVVQTVQQPVYTQTANGYHVILVSTGTCVRTLAVDILQDLFSYSAVEASQLLNMIPVEIGCGLSMQQATAITQVLAEYGMQVAVTDGVNYIDINRYATGSAFTMTGALTQGILSILQTLTYANRVNSFVRWAYSDPHRYAFSPRYTRPPRPRYERGFFGAPRPAPRPAPRGPMGGPAPRPAPRPAQPRGPMGGPAPRPTPAPSQPRGSMGGPGGFGGNRGPGGPGGNRGPGGGRRGGF